MIRSDQIEITAALGRLADPLGGMVTGGASHTFAADEPSLVIQSFNYRFPEAPDPLNPAKLQSRMTKGASGSAASHHEALLPAFAEMLERQAASCIDQTRIFTATADELGDYALNLTTLPSCSAAELERSGGYLSPPRSDLPLRWVEGVSLTSGQPRAIPHSLVYLYAGKLSPQERLQAPISTGLAAHKTLPDALNSALLEVVERDALSIMWLQKIPGHRLHPTMPSWSRSASAQLQYSFFDITTDLDVPVVCCVRTAPFTERDHTLIACAAGFDRAKLIDKTVRDVSAVSISFRKPRPIPASYADFTAIHHGATFMANKARASAFSFLLEGDRSDVQIEPRSLGSNSHNKVDSPHRQLTTLIAKLKNAGMEAYAIDLTSVEAHSVGMHVVRVIIPGLQPLPYRYLARYLGHPRLYGAAHRMGCRVLSESEINPWPIPFA